MPGLTTVQLQTLKADIAANANTITFGGVGTQIKNLPNNDDGNAATAAWYNQEAAGPWVVWRDLAMEDVLNQITFANMTPADVVPTVTALPASPTTAQNATYNNQVATLHTWNARANACQGKQFNLQNLTIGRTAAPMKRANYRAAVQDALTNIPAGAGGNLLAANWVGVRDAAKFNATNAEKLFSTGTGTTAAPADLGYEGPISGADVLAARNS